MIRYSKGAQPSVLTELQNARPPPPWDSAPRKSEIREAVVRDQASLCAYCQTRIVAAEKSVRLAHVVPRNKGGDVFAWSNLVGSCTAPDSCDVHQQDTELWLHPVQGQGQDPEVHLSYGRDGRVKSEDARAEDDIKALNLNSRSLIQARKVVLDGLRDVGRRRYAGRFPASFIEGQLRLCEIRSGTLALPHARFLAYHLKRWLR